MVTRVLAGAGLAVVAVVVALALVEGLASLAISAGLFLGRSGHVELDRFTRYDAELGWVSRPHVVLPNLYGPGVGLHTTAKGFRGTREPSNPAAAGLRRVVCSGDSFTFGVGVGDADTWCARLAEHDPRLEPINMGQGGYGVDQAFLWYRRDGAELAPAIHVFAFIDGDFGRMRDARFVGDYGKPTLALRDGALVVENVPAWRRPFWMPTIRVREIIRRTKTFELVGRIQRRVAPAPPPVVDADERTALVEVALAVFAELRALAARHGTRLVLVYLPTGFDCALPVDAPPGLEWWRAIEPRARAAGFEIVDPTADCRRLPRAEQAALFLPEGVVDFWGAAGHYTVAGHRFIATRVAARVTDDAPAAASSRR